MLKIQAPFLVVLLLLAAAFSQEDCPNPVSDCPDVCPAEDQCDRFLNAECRVDPCNGECSSAFFWRGRNVTDRCGVLRCSDIEECPARRRLCVETVRPATCPERQPQCRQYILARCVLPRTCEELACPSGTICAENYRDHIQCFKSVALSCDDLRCPRGHVCVSQGIPSRNLTVAQCLPREQANSLPTVNTFSCGSGATICTDSTTEACVDIFDSGRLFLASCLQIGCDLETNSPCPDSRICTAIPDRPFSTACVSSTSVLDIPCTDEPGRCPDGLVCRETQLDGDLLFSTCGIPAATFTGPSCRELECPLPLVCNDLESVEGRVGLARCAGPEFTDDHEESIQALLDMISSEDE